jgi:hypothetical protein
MSSIVVSTKGDFIVNIFLILHELLENDMESIDRNEEEADLKQNYEKPITSNERFSQVPLLTIPAGTLACNG